MVDKEQILRLKHGECYTVPEGDYGKAEIYCINEQYLLFEIPEYGGRPTFFRNYERNRIDNMIEDCEGWT